MLNKKTINNDFYTTTIRRQTDVRRFHDDTICLFADVSLVAFGFGTTSSHETARSSSVCYIEIIARVMFSSFLHVSINSSNDTTPSPLRSIFWKTRSTCAATVVPSLSHGSANFPISS